MGPDGVDRHRGAMVVLSITPNGKEASMVEVSIIGIDLSKNSYQFHGARRRIGSVPVEAVAVEGSALPGVAAALHGGDGGVRERALLGP